MNLHLSRDVDEEELKALRAGDTVYVTCIFKGWRRTSTGYGIAKTIAEVQMPGIEVIDHTLRAREGTIEILGAQIMRIAQAPIEPNDIVRIGVTDRVLGKVVSVDGSTAFVRMITEGGHKLCQLSELRRVALPKDLTDQEEARL